MGNMNGSTITTIAVVAFILLLVLILSVIGSLEYRFGDDAVTIHASLWDDYELPYSDIAKIEVKEGIDSGRRTLGYGSTKMNLGHFANAEFGDYLLYAYAKTDVLIVITLKDGAIVACNADGPEATMAVYNELSGRLR